MTNRALKHELQNCHPSQTALILRIYLAGAEDFAKDFNHHAPDCLDLKEGAFRAEVDSFSESALNVAIRYAAGLKDS
jgi:hypothetical protein